MGSSKAVKDVIAWETNMMANFFNVVQFGWSEYNQKMLVIHSGSIVNLMPRTKFTEFESEEWWKRLMVDPPNWLPPHIKKIVSEVRDR